MLKMILGRLTSFNAAWYSLSARAKWPRRYWVSPRSKCSRALILAAVWALAAGAATVMAKANRSILREQNLTQLM